MEDWKPQWLGLLTLRHLADIGQKHLPQLKDYVDLNTRLQTERNEITDEASTLAEKWRKFTVKHKPKAEQLARLMHDSTVAGVDPSQTYSGALLEKQRNLSKAKTLQERNELKEVVRLETIRIKEHPKLQARFNRLPKAAQDLFKEVRDSYRQQSMRTLKALEARVTDSEMSGTQKALIDKMRLQFEQARLEGPYFPLARFGDYWISARDKQNQKAFFMFESHSDLRKAEKELSAQGYTGIKSGRKLDKLKFLDGASEGFIGELNTILKDHGISNSSPVMDEIYQAYLKTMPDLSMRTQFIHRKKTKGFSNDALRTFAYHSMHSAIQTARLKYAGKMNHTLQQMKEAVQQSDDRVKATALYNEVQKRHEWVMNPTNSPLAQKASSIGFAWYLGATPAAAAVNLTQNALVAMPVIGSQFGISKAFNKMNNVLGEFLKAKGDFNASLEGDRLKAFKAMQKTGAINLSLSHNLAGLSDTDTLNYSPKTHKVMTGISWLFHKAEVLNRSVTGMTAYDLHYAKYKDQTAAIRYAEDVIWESHFDYSNANRARFMQSNAAKALLMFRQYSLNVTYYLWRNFYQTFKGESKEVRLEARKKLTGTLAISSLMSGALGLPMVTTGFAIANLAQGLFGDDDEPYDAEAETRSFFADYFGKEAAKYILDGPTNQITGASVASRVKLNDLWLREPYRDMEGRDLYHYYLEQIAGPMGGIVLGAMRGTQLIEEGKVQRGFETMLPKALKDAAKALRYEQEGVNNLAGSPLIDDVTAYEEIIQAMGFSPARVIDQYAINNALKNYEKHITKRRSRLLAMYALAHKHGDITEKRRVLKLMRVFSKKYPELRITRKTLKRSLRTRQRYANERQNGIRLNKKLKDRLYDEVSF